MTAVLDAEAWLYSTLSNDSVLAGLLGLPTTGGIYSTQAPEGASYPLVVYQLTQSTDANAPGFVRVLTEMVYAIHCADRVNSLANLDAIASRVDVLVHGQTVSLPGGALQLGSTRLRQHVLAGAVAGVPTRDLVSTYSIVIREA